MTWFPILLIVGGAYAVWWGWSIFFSKKFYTQWATEVWQGDDSFGKSYGYNRFLRAFDSFVCGLGFLLMGILVFTYNFFPYIGFAFIVFPVIGFVFLISGIAIMVSKKGSDLIWQSLWHVQSVEKNRQLLATHLIVWGFVLSLTPYFFLYVTGQVPRIDW